jgi:hypothetical protein
MEKDPKWEVVNKDDPPRKTVKGKRSSRTAGIALLVVIAVVLVILFPPVLAFVEIAARQLRYLWWLILLLALGIWLIVAARKSKD